MRRLLFILLFIPFVALQAQTTKQEMVNDILQTGATYYSYYMPNQKLTPAPLGYKPFYISHYGRHGSRYMINNISYKTIIETMNEAQKQNVLTPLGKDILEGLNIAYKDAVDREGELSLLGAKQHREIAQRMFYNYPEIFSNPIKIDARASTILRCVLSMSNFCLELQRLNPQIKIAVNSRKKDMQYIAWTQKAGDSHNKNEKLSEKKLHEFMENIVSPDRFINQLFISKQFVIDNIKKPSEFIEYFFDIAQDMQCVPEIHVSFFDLFTKDELFNIWQRKNASWYCHEGFYPGFAQAYRDQYPLLKNILDTADEVIGKDSTTVTLRFGHDSVLVPITYLLRLSECYSTTNKLDDLYKHWSLSKISPMGGNLQIVFYRKDGSKDILVKFVLNEKETSIIGLKTDCAPYYHWKEVEAYYRAELQKNNYKN